MTEPQPPQPNPVPGQGEPASYPTYPPQGGTPPGQPYPQYNPAPVGQPSKGMAITALVLAIVPIPFTWIAAIVLAIIVLVRSKDGRAHGKGMAISALVIATLWLIALVALIVAAIAGQADRDSTGKVVNSGDVSVASIRVGDCLVDQPGASAQFLVKLTPCSKPHREEAYANFDLPRGSFPGQDEVDRLSEAGCFSRFEQYVGVSAEKTSLEVVYLRPLKQSWGKTRGVTCMVSDGSAATGSLKDSKR